jgi:hypothetical protein
MHQKFYTMYSIISMETTKPPPPLSPLPMQSIFPSTPSTKPDRREAPCTRLEMQFQGFIFERGEWSNSEHLKSERITVQLRLYGAPVRFYFIKT